MRLAATGSPPNASYGDESRVPDVSAEGAGAEPSRAHAGATVATHAAAAPKVMNCRRDSLLI